MALILPDSRCAICGHRLQDAAFRGFPHFAGPYDAFAHYSDAGVHKRCFDAAPEKDTIEWLLARGFPGGNKLSEAGVALFAETSAGGSEETAERWREHHRTLTKFSDWGELLKRALFLQWYVRANPEALTGLGSFDEVA